MIRFEMVAVYISIDFRTITYQAINFEAFKHKIKFCISKLTLKVKYCSILNDHFKITAFSFSSDIFVYRRLGPNTMWNFPRLLNKLKVITINLKLNNMRWIRSNRIKIKHILIVANFRMLHYTSFIESR